MAALFDPLGCNPAAYGPILRIVLDSQPTLSSQFTSTKTTHRPQYDAARSRAGIPPIGTPPKPEAYHDVLIFNEHREVTEASIRNIALYRSGAWRTPSINTGCLPGVVRRLLLEKQLVQEVLHNLTVDDVRDGEWLLLFNGVEGCRIGRLHVQGVS
jgi:4-amino-4-deoxychorismate lyase